MKICDFTKPELDRFRKVCNFTEIERQCFDLKAKGLTNYQLAMELNVCDSTVSSTMKSIRAKITAVSEEKIKKQETATPESLNPIIAVEAMFELDPFDREAQKDFEEAIDNL